MKVWLKLAGVVLAAVSLSASAAQMTISTTADQSGFLGAQSGGSYPLTAGLGFDFSGQEYFKLVTIDAIQITLTASDGDTGVGDFDRDSLFLALDGINAGIPLNDLLNDNIVTRTVGQLGVANQAAILAQLQADGRLVGTVIDTDADGPPGDLIGFPSAAGQIFAVLDITGTFIFEPPPPPVPIPAALPLSPLGAGLAGAYSRRFRRTKYATGHKI
jgi:hypothetical protein